MSRLPIDRGAAQAAGFWTKKRLGQHLLRDPQVVADGLQALAAGPEDGILEIGPGLGALTEALLNLGGPVLAVEVDPAACEALKLRFEGRPNFRLIQADVLKTDLREACAGAFGARPFHVAANLPYYITTPVLVQLLESRLAFGRMVVLTQLEVAQRLAASPGQPEWAAISVLAQFHCRVTLLRKVLRGAFTPVPKVDSALLLFERRERPAVAVKDEELFFKVARSGFGMRRKTLRNALRMAPGLDFTGEQLDTAFGRAGLDSGRRGETLTLDEWAALSDALVAGR